MTKQERDSLRRLAMSDELKNVLLAEVTASGINFEMPKSWQKHIRSVKLKNHEVAYAMDECTFGVYAGRKFSEMGIPDLVKLINYGVLDKGESTGSPGRFFWRIVSPSIKYRKQEIITAIEGRVSVPLKKTKSGYLDRTYYQKVGDRLVDFKFEVGDKVKVVERMEYLQNIKKGMVGVILKRKGATVSGNCYWAAFKTGKMWVEEKQIQLK